MVRSLRESFGETQIFLKESAGSEGAEDWCNAGRGALPYAVNTTTSPQLPKYVSAAFGSLDQPWKPGHLRSAYGAVCCHRFKPKNMTDDIFLAQILGHKLLPGAAGSVSRAELQGFLCRRKLKWTIKLC